MGDAEEIYQFQHFYFFSRSSIVSMEHNKGLFQVSAYCWETLKFLSDTPFYFYPILWLFSFYSSELKRKKKKKDEKRKDRNFLKLNFYFGVCDYSVVWNVFRN